MHLEEFGDGSEPAPAAPAATGERTLAQVAPHTGFSGPQGVKNFLYRLLGKLARVESVPNDEMDALIDFAAGEYVDVLQQADAIDEEDADLMMKNKNIVFDLPSFKFFLAKAITRPALKELEKTGKAKGDVYLDKLGLTAATKNSVMNQLLGQVPKDLNALNAKIDKDVEKGKLTAEKGEDAKDKLRSGFDAIKKLVMAGDDFVEVALELYSKMPKRKLIDVVKKASEDPYVAEKTA